MWLSNGPTIRMVLWYGAFFLNLGAALLNSALPGQDGWAIACGGALVVLMIFRPFFLRGQ